MRPLVLVGGGGHCKSVIDVAESAGYAIKGILDIPDLLGVKILNYRVIGIDEDFYKYVQDCDFVVTLGFIKDPSHRIGLHDKILDAGGSLATIVAPTARISKYAEIGPGTVVLHNATINADTNIGMGCIINTGAIIEHDVVIGDYCHISTGAIVNGGCHVGDASFIGSQSVLRNGISVEPRCVVGAGSVVCSNILQQGIYFGNPARMKK